MNAFASLTRAIDRMAKIAADLREENVRLRAERDELRAAQSLKVTIPPLPEADATAAPKPFEIPWGWSVGHLECTHTPGDAAGAGMYRLSVYAGGYWSMYFVGKEAHKPIQGPSGSADYNETDRLNAGIVACIEAFAQWAPSDPTKAPEPWVAPAAKPAANGAAAVTSNEDLPF